VERKVAKMNINKGDRLTHKFQGGEYKVVSIDDNFLKVKVVNKQWPESKWDILTYRIQDCYNDWVKINQ